MPAEAARNGLTRRLKGKPFDCDVVVVYKVTDHGPVACDDQAKAVERLYPKRIEALCRRESGAVESWDGRFYAAGQPGERTLLHYYYGACRLGDLLLVVGKRSAPEGQGVPIDSFFLDALRLVAAELLELPAEGGSAGVGEGARGAQEEVFREIARVKQFEHLWRRKYGPDAWLAVRGGTVVAHAKSRRELEERLAAEGIEAPVLHVPPEGEEAHSLLSEGRVAGERKE